MKLQISKNKWGSVHEFKYHAKLFLETSTTQKRKYPEKIKNKQWNDMVRLKKKLDDVVLGAITVVFAPKKKKKDAINYREKYQEYLKSPHWQALRIKALDRDLYLCRICRSSKKLHVHHRSYKNKGLNGMEIEDLTTLCEKCHNLFHKHGRLSRQ